MMMLGAYFQKKKKLRQGDRLSLLLFNIIADILATLINRAKVDRQVCGVAPPLVELYAFEQLSSLKISFHKIELFCFGAQDIKKIIH